MTRFYYLFSIALVGVGVLGFVSLRMPWKTRWKDEVVGRLVQILAIPIAASALAIAILVSQQSTVKPDCWSAIVGVIPDFLDSLTLVLTLIFSGIAGMFYAVLFNWIPGPAGRIKQWASHSVGIATLVVTLSFPAVFVHILATDGPARLCSI